MASLPEEVTVTATELSTLGAVVYLIRHGRTALNAQGVLRGQLDPPLDEVGRAQARALGSVLATRGCAGLWSSPLLRARQTAEAISATTGLIVHILPALADRHYGAWAGHTRGELVERFGSLSAAPGVEPWPAFAERVAGGLHTLSQRSDEGPLAVVAHDAVNRALLCSVLPGSHFESIPQRVGCWNRLEGGQGTWRVTALDVLPG